MAKLLPSVWLVDHVTIVPDKHIVLIIVVFIHSLHDAVLKPFKHYVYIFFAFYK